MTIEKGKDWGAKGDVPVDTPVVDSDAALAPLGTAASSCLV